MSKDGEFFSLPNFKHVLMVLLNNLLFCYCKSFLSEQHKGKYFCKNE